MSWNPKMGWLRERRSHHWWPFFLASLCQDTRRLWPSRPPPNIPTINTEIMHWPPPGQRGHRQMLRRRSHALVLGDGWPQQALPLKIHTCISLHCKAGGLLAQGPWEGKLTVQGEAARGKSQVGFHVKKPRSDHPMFTRSDHSPSATRFRLSPHQHRATGARMQTFKSKKQLSFFSQKYRFKSLFWEGLRFASIYVSKYVAVNFLS